MAFARLFTFGNGDLVSRVARARLIGYAVLSARSSDANRGGRRFLNSSASQAAQVAKHGKVSLAILPAHGPGDSHLLVY